MRKYFQTPDDAANLVCLDFFFATALVFVRTQLIGRKKLFWKAKFHRS